MVDYKPWLVTPVDGTNIHVHPVHDLIGHDIEGDCICGPRVEPVEQDDGEIIFRTTHHSLER